jgi:hypothetical protein
LVLERGDTIDIAVVDVATDKVTAHTLPRCKP